MRYFIRYFINYVFQSKTRQGLIILVVLGLALCSFALTVLQGTMHGLQSSMMNRYQSIEGKYIITTLNNSEKTSSALEKVHQSLKLQKIPHYPALVLEVLLKQNEFIAPALLTAFDQKIPWPKFLEDQDQSGIILGADLGAKLKAGPFNQINMYSPTHTISMLGDVPQFMSEETSGFMLSGFEDLDVVRAWSRLSLAQNLIREEKINQIIFYSEDNFSQVSNIIAPYKSLLTIKTWQEQRPELMWAFQLETMVMVFIFTMMAVLVSLTIISSCSLFLNKIKLEMFVFWLLGESSLRIKKGLFATFQIIILISISLGLTLGLLLLLYLDLKSPIIMPEVFLERSIPVVFHYKYNLISFFIPYLISSFFIFWSLKEFFANQNSFSTLIKRVE
jgi:lipoprotein-releasing system permease protein